MLLPREQELVLELLIKQTALAETPRTVMAAGLLNHLARRLPSGTPESLARAALNLCLEDSYKTTPPAMVTLLRLVEQLDEETPRIIARIYDPPPKAADVFEALILDTKVPFLARRDTRANLRALLQAKPIKPVVVVNGATGMGKTHTTAFIEHVLRENCAIQHCIVSLTEGQGRSIGPRELASDIMVQLGGNPRTLPPECTNGARWVKELVNEVIYAGVGESPVAANHCKPTWWIVLDGFKAPELRDDTKQFIVTLAASLTAGRAQEQFRLILLDFDATVLTVPPTKVASEVTAPIATHAVSLCVGHLAADQPDTVRKRVVARVLQGLTDPVQNLPMLAARLGEVIRILRA